MFFLLGTEMLRNILFSDSKLFHGFSSIEHLCNIMFSDNEMLRDTMDIRHRNIT